MWGVVAFGPHPSIGVGACPAGKPAHMPQVYNTITEAVSHGLELLAADYSTMVDCCANLAARHAHFSSQSTPLAAVLRHGASSLGLRPSQAHQRHHWYWIVIWRMLPTIVP